MAWYDNLPAFKKPHDACGGTGSIEGQTDPLCGGTGEVDLWKGQPDQTEWYVKWIAVQVADVLTKLDALDSKMDALENKLDDLEQKIESLDCYP